MFSDKAVYRIGDPNHNQGSVYVIVRQCLDRIRESDLGCPVGYSVQLVNNDDCGMTYPLEYFTDVFTIRVRWQRIPQVFPLSIHVDG